MSRQKKFVSMVEVTWLPIKKGHLPSEDSYVARYSGILGWTFERVDSGNVAYRKTVKAWKPFTHFAKIPGPDGRTGTYNTIRRR